jgi:hypothetical protein
MVSEMYNICFQITALRHYTAELVWRHSFCVPEKRIFQACLNYISQVPISTISQYKQCMKTEYGFTFVNHNPDLL